MVLELVARLDARALIGISKTLGEIMHSRNTESSIPLCTFAICLLAAVSVGVPQPLRASVVFTDDFEGSFDGQWEVVHGNGRAEVRDGRLVVHPGAYGEITILRPVTSEGQPFTVSDVRMTGIATGSGDIQSGFVLRLDVDGPTNSSSPTVVNGSPPGYLIGRDAGVFASSNESIQLIGAVSPVPDPLPDWFVDDSLRQLEATVSGSMISTRMFPVADPSDFFEVAAFSDVIQTGEIGLWAINRDPGPNANAFIEFDDIQVFGPASFQRSPFFWDEFDRGDLFDTDIKYVRDETPEEEYEMVDGSLFVNALADEFPAVRVDVSGEMEDFIIKTKGRILNNSSCQWSWLGVYGRGQESGTFDFNDAHAPLYWAGYATDGNVSMGKTIDRDNDANVFFGQRRKYTCQQVTENDVHMEFRIEGDRIEFTSWLDGTPRPTSPDRVANDDSFTVNDYVGVFANPDRLEDFVLRYLAILPAIEGDFDASGELEATDIDLLSAELMSGETDRAFDLNGDAAVTEEDRLVLIHDLLGTWIGDSNLDGQFDSRDFVQVFQVGQYEDQLVGNSTWGTGDWSGDGEFDSTDFVVAFQEGGYEKGLRNASATQVPEPNAAIGFVLGAHSLWLAYRRRGGFCQLRPCQS